MNFRSRLPELILVALSIVGGFGIVRVIFIRHDPLGLSAIIAALALTWVFLRFVTSGRFSARSDTYTPQHIQLTTSASDSLEIFPGRSQGYVGYTENVAMSATVNEELAARHPSEQYALLGFGNGFLDGIQSRIADGEGIGRVHFRVIDASQKHKESIGWLAYLQRRGTDNAGPSTENLHSTIRWFSREIASNGPITMTFWDKVNNKQNESLDLSGTSREMLNEWTDLYQTTFEEGQRQAVVAVIVDQAV